MALSRLLALVREQAESLKHEGLSDRYPRNVLFFSLSDGQERAHVSIARGESFEQAWQEGERALKKWAKQQSREPVWLRVDSVCQPEELSWAELKEKLDKTKRNYFRFGIAFDPQFNQAMLEQEIAASAVLYDGQQGVAIPNEINLKNYTKRRFGKALQWPNDDQQRIWRFKTRALFTDGEQVFPIEHLGRNSGYRRIQGWPEVQVPQVIDSATDYLARQIKPSGEYYYGWFPCFDRVIPSYNALRHASSTYALLEGWELTRDPEQKAAIDRTLKYLTSQLIHRKKLADGSVAAFLVDTGNEIKLGGNAVSILALAKYTELTGDQQYVELMECLANGIASMQNPQDGSFVHVLNFPDLSLKAAHRIIYYDGEAAFGLIRLYALTGNERWLQVVEKAFDYFIAQEHWQAHDHWLSYCVNELTLYRPSVRYYQFGLDNVRDHLDFVLNRITTYPTLLELMMAAQRMITRIKSDSEYAHLLEGFDTKKFYRALEVRARYLLNGFFWPEMAMFFKQPAKIVGSFFIRHHSYRVRIDDVEHYLSGYVAYLKYLKQPGPILKEDTPAEVKSHLANSGKTERVLFLCENLRNVGNGIEVATLNRSRLFDRQLGQTPWIVTSAYSPQLVERVAEFKQQGLLPQQTEVFNVYNWLVTMRKQGRIKGLSEGLPAGLTGLPDTQPDQVTAVKYFDDEQQTTHEMFVDDQQQILLNKRYQVIRGKNTLVSIEMHSTEQGVVSWSQESAFVAAILEANLDPQVRWHFIVDKNRPWRDFVNSKPAERFNATLSIVIHSTHRTASGLIKGSYQHIFSQPELFDQLLVLTHEQQQDLLSEGFPATKLRVIPHAIEPERLPDSLQKVPTQRVIYMARYAAEKQHRLLINAFERVVKVVPQAKLHTYGKGALRNELKQLVQHKNLENNITIDGFSSDLAAIHQHAYCAVLCSEHEGFSLLGLESLAYGTPLVSFNIKYGPRDLLEGFDAGVLVDAGKEEALADALIDLLRHPEKQQRMQDQALLSAKRFSDNLVAVKWQAWWSALQPNTSVFSEAKKEATI